MYVFFRLIYGLLRSWRLPRVSPLSEVRTPLIILPNDLDSNFHLNNGRYLTLADIGRFDLVVRSGMAGIMRARRWYPVVASAAVRFRKQLQCFERFDLVTQIVHWDERWFYIEHRYEKDGFVHARVLIKGIFKGPQGTVSVKDILAAMNVHDDPGVQAERLLLFQEFEQSFRDMDR